MPCNTLMDSSAWYKWKNIKKKSFLVALLSIEVQVEKEGCLSRFPSQYLSTYASLWEFSRMYAHLCVCRHSFLTQSAFFFPPQEKLFMSTHSDHTFVSGTADDMQSKLKNIHSVIQRMWHFLHSHAHRTYVEGINDISRHITACLWVLQHLKSTLSKTLYASSLLLQR